MNPILFYLGAFAAGLNIWVVARNYARSRKIVLFNLFAVFICLAGCWLAGS